MTVGGLETAIDELAPFVLAEEWDNVGLQVGRRDRPVNAVLVALDLRGEVLDEAAARGCQAIVVHHPPIFPTLTSVTDSAGPAELILQAAECEIAVVAAHTNLDSAAGGLNELMAAALGVFGTAPIAPNPDQPDLGLGRIGKRPRIRLGDLLAKIREIYGEGEVTRTGDPADSVETVACCTGSGAGLIDAVRELGADVYVTCDLKYHDADRAGQMSLVGLGHATVESRAMRRWSEKLAAKLQPDVGVHFAETDTDPWSPPR
ncbi:MAG: Nif3-like dinuclear metal center hexameric protein [Thermoleophilia bacterium]|nr:Nif3-like dinuclear metal center hexameric protein [Thermoleophilia bacterium]